MDIYQMDTPRAEFPFVQKYKDTKALVAQQQQLEEQDMLLPQTACPDFFIYPDQEVPELSTYITDEKDFKIEIKTEANSPSGENLHINSDTENSINSYSNIDSIKHHNLPTTLFETNHCNYNSPNNDNTSPLHNTSSHHNTSPLLSSAALPIYSTFPISDSRTQDTNSYKSSNYISEVAGSGCTVFTQKSNLMSHKLSNEQHFLSTDSLSSNSSFSMDDLTPPSMSKNIDFLDLDRHQDDVSFYDEVKSYPTEDEELMNMLKTCSDIQTSLHHDCQMLNISHDPMMWSTENVNVWIDQICKRKECCNPCNSHNRNVIDGNTLCSLQDYQFAEVYGHVLGDHVFKELQLLQVANNNLETTPMSQSSSYDEPQFNFSDYQSPPSEPVSSNLPLTVNCMPPSPSSSSQDSDDEEGTTPPPLRAKTCVTKTGRRGHKHTIHLWQFLRELLVTDNKETCIRWINRETGVFKIEDSKRVAFLWGSRKNRPAMNYDKLSRSVRQYYKKGIIKKTEQSKRLVYQFCAGYL